MRGKLGQGKLIYKESLSTKKLINEESWYMRKADCWGNLIDDKSQCKMKGNWWEKMIDKESWIIFGEPI